MTLTPSQLTTLKADIDANSGAGGDFEPYVGDLSRVANQAIADNYNLIASPDHWVFKTNASVQDVISGIDFDEYVLLSDGQRQALNLLIEDRSQVGGGNGGVTMNVSPVAARTALTVVFPAVSAPNSRAGVLDAGVRLATRGEALLAVDGVGPAGGDGSAKASSRSLTHEGQITQLDVANARRLP